LAFMADCAGKLAGRVLRVAGLLHLAAGHAAGEEVSLDTMHAAVQIGEWALTHAVAVYGGWRTPEHNIGAERVLRWIRRTGRVELVALAEAGWVTSVERTMRDGKRRLRDGVFIPHPSLLGE